MTIPIVTQAAELKAQVAAWKGARQAIALVPTMGALHEGHLSLVRIARARAPHVVASIFVNPTQFGQNEDYARYPRDLEGDQAKLEGMADLIYAPDVKEMYPDGVLARVIVGGPSAGLESDFRTGHFIGVATVVARLFQQCAPDIAAFGEKDYQQLLVVKRLVRDYNMSIEIVAGPTVREADGLAMSSRNAYLNAEERKIAAKLNRVLADVAARVKSGHPIDSAEAEGQAELLNAGFQRVDYVAIRDAETLNPIRALERPARVLAAAHIGRTRLIDNLPV
ncbi:MAG: pantoate--beta-alanine ligase [Alphaproteobacteria bacterium]